MIGDPSRTPSYGWIDRFAVSPCSNPNMLLDAVLDAYAGLGFRRFEGFSSWAASAFRIEEDGADYRTRLAARGMTLSSFHLPPVNDDGPSLDRAVAAARFAREAGAPVVLFKADTIERYIAAAGDFLDRSEAFGLVPVLQNHFGTAISTLRDFDRVMSGIADSRMRSLLEVGHLHSAGVSWHDGVRQLGDTVALVHIKDQIGTRSVPFGTGEIDLPELFAALDRQGYAGEYVIEMEVTDTQNTLAYLNKARAFVGAHEPGDTN